MRYRFVLVGCLALATSGCNKKKALEAKRQNVGDEVIKLASAEDAYFTVYAEYVEQRTPWPESTLSKEEQAWSWGSQFDEMSWAPTDEKTHGAFTVVLTDGGSSYVVTGQCDLDGDGVLAIWSMEKGGELMLTTPADVF